MLGKSQLGCHQVLAIVLFEVDSREAAAPAGVFQLGDFVGFRESSRI